MLFMHACRTCAQSHNYIGGDILVFKIHYFKLFCLYNGFGYYYNLILPCIVILVNNFPNLSDILNFSWPSTLDISPSPRNFTLPSKFYPPLEILPSTLLTNSTASMYYLLIFYNKNSKTVTLI